MATILLVSSETTTLRSLQTTVVNVGNNTVSTQTVKSAIKTLEINKTIDLVIADILMPKENGFDLLRRMNNNLRLKSIPLILCSEYATPEIIIKSQEAGATDFLVKPFTPELIQPKILRALKNGKKIVLIVEHEKIILEKLKYIIELEGYVVVTASNAKEAFEIIDNSPISIVISDIGLEDMTGIAFAKTLKVACDTLPVILITGLPTKFTKEMADSCQADGFLSMPFRNTEVVSKIRELVRV